MTVSRPFPSLPNLAPHAARREEDDGLDGIESPEAGGAREGYRASVPSVVIAPDAEVAPRPPPSFRRAGQEPTLVIRDRKRVDSLRAEVRRREFKGTMERYRSILLWCGAGVGAFALGGGIVAALGQRPTPPEAVAAAPQTSGISVAEVADTEVPVPSAPSREELTVTGPTKTGLAEVGALPSAGLLPVPTAETPKIVSAAPARAVPVSAVASAASEPASVKAPPSREVVRAPASNEVAPSQKSVAAEPVAAEPAAEPPAAKRAGNVVSLDDLPGE